MADKTRWAPGASALAEAARAVAAVIPGGRSAEDALEPFNRVAERAAIRAIALGTLRWYLRLAPAIDAFLERPEGIAREIKALLVVSAHQIEYSRNVVQSTVHAAVDATRILRASRASGLVNAVLRRFASERQRVLARLDGNIAVRCAHPSWLADLLQDRFGTDAEAVLTANNEHPPMVLRVDLTRSSVSDYLARLAAAGIVGEPISWAPAAVRLKGPVPVNDLPGFATGVASVQDAGAQLAVPLLDAIPGMRVLDACAAPGGKTGHILEHTSGLAELVAVDADSERAALIRENLDRLGRAATVHVADLREPESFWDGRPFDRILIDAPCSSTGVIRRHPDIKLLRRQSDIPALAATQRQILQAGLRMLAPGGRLVYATCSLLSAENEDVVSNVIGADPSIRVAPTPRPWQPPPAVRQRAPGLQLIPGTEAGTDGFYYACVEKTTTAT